MTRLQKFVNSIFGAIFGVPVSASKSIFSTILDWTAAMYAEFALIVMRRIEADFAPTLQATIKKAEDSKRIPPEIQPLLNEIKNPTAPIGAFLGNAAGTSVTGGLLSSTLGPQLKLVEYYFNSVAKQQRFDPTIALALLFRSAMTEKNIDEILSRLGAGIPGITSTPTNTPADDLIDLGWSPERVTAFWKAMSSRLEEDLLVELRRRDKIDQVDYEKRMFALGYRQKEANDYLLASAHYPMVSDLVRMAVREVFDPKQRLELQLDADYPAEFDKRAQQIGLDPTFAKDYWAAHWELPSANMGYEMLHRKLITPAQLDDLLKALDYSPAWRSKLKDLSYATFTRVDIRRMHKLGVLKDGDLVNAYMRIGYSEADAGSLADFTLKLNAGTATDSEKELTKSELLKAFKERLYTQEEAEEALRELGYGDAEIWLLLTMSQEQAALKTRDLTLSQVKDLYQKGLRTKLDCSAFLSAFGYDAAEITALYDLWDWEKPQADRLPTRTDFDNFVAAGIITMQEWSDGYTALGYDMKYQEWYFAYLVAKGKLD